MESGVLDKGDIQKVQGRGACRTGLGTTDLDHCTAPVADDVIEIYTVPMKTNTVYVLKLYEE